MAVDMGVLPLQLHCLVTSSLPRTYSPLPLNSLQTWISAFPIQYFVLYSYNAAVFLALDFAYV
jgi:hypothetical protein